MVQTTSKALLEKQNEIHNQIASVARANGLTTATTEPIYDGVYVPANSPTDTTHMENYLRGPRVMWVLKESWDETDGGVSGGGWTVYHAFDDHGATGIKTWKVMAYALYGIRTGTRYNDMPEADARMLDLLKDVAYVNVSKMPGGTSSNASAMARAFSTWRPTLEAQIAAYDPEVIIFGGTFGLCSIMFTGRKSFGHEGCHVCGGRLLIDAHHPNQRSIGWAEYVDGIAVPARKFLGK